VNGIQQVHVGLEQSQVGSYLGKFLEHTSLTPSRSEKIMFELTRQSALDFTE